MIKSEAIRLPFAFAAGEVGSEYLDGLREGRFLATRCDPCGKTLSPARSLCPYCGGATKEPLARVGPDGDVQSWTRVPRHGTYVLVRLDGADTATLHRLVGDAMPTIGQRARPCLAEGELMGFEVVTK